jgi:CDP-glycerol glycerophosphotransferase (TagB/SpsB family)
VISDPLWMSNKGGEWTGFIPTREDVALLVNVVHHSDVVVNVGSTMAMDFAILDKPGIYLAYNPQESNKNKGWNVHDLYRLPHFRSVHELQPVHWAYEAEDLAAAIMQVLSNPQEKSRARGQWLSKHAKHPLDQASERCYEALCQIV